MKLRERALGAYLGFAVGDALGAPVEFMTADEIRHAHGTLRTMIGGGWLRLRPGQITDDTQMSLHLGRALIAAQGWDARAAAEEFAVWLRGHPIDVGNTCRRGIRRYLLEGSLAGPMNEADGGNGAAMRILPLALATLHDDAGFAIAAREQAHITHHHPLSDAATLGLGRMLHRLLRGEGIAAARETVAALVAAHGQFRFDPWPGRASGYIVDTMQTVLHHFFASEGFEDCLVGIVNRGGDADTNGALAGMLAGALHGVDAIPRFWLNRLERTVTDEIEMQTDALLKLALLPAHP
uniref:Dinitrogenase reductase activating glycohydrolase n=1 Tax=uncultured bacterium UPO35 TaxID=1776962 RepID=A0A126SXK2_9BACT|nr:dinitrogenase reductase activating glycohydrolase [uncultured bacterium UPO35]